VWWGDRHLRRQLAVANRRRQRPSPPWSKSKNKRPPGMMQRDAWQHGPPIGRRPPPLCPSSTVVNPPSGLGWRAPCRRMAFIDSDQGCRRLSPAADSSRPAESPWWHCLTACTSSRLLSRLRGGGGGLLGAGLAGAVPRRGQLYSVLRTEQLSPPISGQPGLASTPVTRTSASTRS